jgi:DNA-binding transcriptional MocR family regulator
MASFGLFIKPSSATDALLYAMLTGPSPSNAPGGFDSYADWFIHTNQERMGHAYRYMRDRLEKMGLEVIPSTAGHFLWTKVPDELGWNTWDEELAGFERIFDGGVYIVSASFERVRAVHSRADRRH